MIAANTGIAKMEPVFVRRATGAVTAHCHQSPSLVSVPSIAFAAVCSSALRFTKLRVLDPPTSVTPNALKNAFLSVLQVFLSSLNKKSINQFPRENAREPQRDNRFAHGVRR